MGKHFAFVVPMGHGHVNPTLPLVEELLRRGHRVSYATGPQLLSVVAKTGASPVELPWVLDIKPRAGMRFTVDTMVAMQSQFLENAFACFPTLVAHFGRDRPDALCADGMISLGAAVADKLAVPEVALIPSYARNEHFDLRSIMSAPDFDWQHPRLLELHAKSAAFAADHGLTVPVAPMMLMSASHAALKLVFIPRLFQIAGDTFDDTFHFIGPSLGSRAHSGGWRPPVDGSPVLFIALGTVFNHRPDIFALCIQAFGDSPWHVVMAVGETVDPATLGPIPANFEVQPYFPQLVVLGHARAFLSHTGMNSTMESLYHAVPLIALPQMPEQEANARRAEELGFGRRLDPDNLTPQLLRETVEEVADDLRIRANLTQISQELRTSGGAAAGADALEALLGSR